MKRSSYWSRGQRPLKGTSNGEYRRRGNGDPNAELSRLSQAQLNTAGLRLNQRPRQTLLFEIPGDRLKKAFL